MSDHYRRGEPELGCAALIFLVFDAAAACLCLWAVLASGQPVLVLVGLLGLFGVILSAGGVLFGEPSSW